MNHLMLFNERANDKTKVEFVKKYWYEFLKYCKDNIKKITKDLLETAYYNFQIFDLNIIITIDNFFSTLGQYNDENKELTICFYSPFKQFLKNIDELEELEDYERELIEEGITAILTDPTYVAKNDFTYKIYNDLKLTFLHEVTHHYDSVHYGKDYFDSAGRLEDIKHSIIDDEKRFGFYVNMPHEIDAAYLSALALLIDNHGEGYGDFRQFFEMFLEYFRQYPDLSDINKKRVHKRLYNYYERLRNI